MLVGQRLADGDEAGAHVGGDGAHGEGGNDVAAGAERAGEDDGLVGDLADSSLRDSSSCQLIVPRLSWPPDWR